MSVLGLICVLLALVATLLFVLFLFQRRDLRAISELSLTVQRAVSGERLPQRIEMEPGHETQLDVQALGVSVNQLLLRAARTTGREKAGPKLFTELGERIHEAVLVHRDVILYANSQFASFVGVDRVNLVDRRLSDLVAPEYAELVADNLRRRLAGAHGAERFEVEMVGMQGQVSLLELTTAQIDFEGAPALLVTGVEVIPTKKLRALATVQHRREGSREARRAGGAAAAAAASGGAAAAGVRDAVAGRGHRHHRRHRPSGLSQPRGGEAAGSRQGARWPAAARGSGGLVDPKRIASCWRSRCVKRSAVAPTRMRSVAARCSSASPRGRSAPSSSRFRHCAMTAANSLAR